MAQRMRKRIIDGLGRRLSPKRWTDQVRSLADHLEERQAQEFLRDTDFSKLDVSSYPRWSIKAGKWPYPVMNMFYCNNMISLITYCLSRRALPYVDVWSKDDGGVNLWEQFFEQPFAEAQAAWGDKRALNCDRTKFRVASFWFPKQRDVELYSKLYQPPIFALNAKTKAYVEDEYEQIFVKRGNPRVIGVLCRGTDYLDAKDHPTQPAVPDVIEDVRKKMLELHCEYVYLATDEYKTQQLFDEAFPGKVLINKRRYYDAFWKIKEEYGSDARIIMVHNDRENDDYYRSLEYLSSLVLLSRCQALIAGSCSGSTTALFMNGGKYEYWHLYNLGRNK